MSKLRFKNRLKEEVITNEKETKTVRFLYHTVLGRFFLKILTRRWISKLVGRYMNSKCSKRRIQKFIVQHSIDMSQYEDVSYHSYNQFFTRKLKEGQRNIIYDPSILISPCDAKLTVYPIDHKNNTFMIKKSLYQLSDLIDNQEFIKKFIGGYCFIFRLTVDDYHRYCYIDEGTKEENHFIPGVLHTVQPIALEKYKVFHRNCREYTLLHTKNFGNVLQIEVGAICVGKIKNYHQAYSFQKGEEKGMFEFGGSTILLIFEKDKIEVDEDLLLNTKDEYETIVKMGEKIGKQKCF